MTISESELRQTGFELQQSREVLEKLGFWSGPDLALNHGLTIHPNTTTNLKLVATPKHLAPVDKLDPNIFPFLGQSVRSCLAQVGLETWLNQAAVDENLARSLETQEVILPFTACNFGQRPLEILTGDRIMRFFYVNPKNRLSGSALEDVVEQKQIEIAGKQGKDWVFVDEEGESLEARHGQTTVAIRFQLTDERLYIPSSDQSLRVTSKEELNNLLQPIPRGKKLFFRVGQTLPIRLGDIKGMLNLGTHGDGGRHLQSPLVDPGYKGPLRTELFGPNHPDWVEMFFFR